MNKSILDQLITKLIEDTKSYKIKWDKPRSDRYIIDRERYFTKIVEIGEISISKIKNAVHFSISSKTEGNKLNSSSDFTKTIDNTDEYYVDIMRLYVLVDNIYMKRISSGSLENAITAYINRTD